MYRNIKKVVERERNRKREEERDMGVRVQERIARVRKRRKQSGRSDTRNGRTKRGFGGEGQHEIDKQKGKSSR